MNRPKDVPIKNADIVKWKIICFIMNCYVQDGYAPTVSEIAHYMGMTKSNAEYYVNQLIREGKVTSEMKARTLKVVGTKVKLFYDDGTEVQGFEIKERG